MRVEAVRRRLLFEQNIQHYFKVDIYQKLKRFLIEHLSPLRKNNLYVQSYFFGTFAIAIQLVSCAAPQANVQESMGLPEEVSLKESTSASDSDGFFTSGQASRGERRFDQLCADCHRRNEIRRTWFGGERHQTVGSLYNVISTTMPDDNPGGLNINQYADIVAFLLSSNGYSEGESELLPDQVILEGISIPLP